MRERAQLLVLLACIVAACGAQTGLRVPCEIPLRKTKPAVMMMINKGGIMGGLVFGSLRPTYWTQFNALVEPMLREIDPVAYLGAVTFPHPYRLNSRCDLAPEVPILPREFAGSAVRDFIGGLEPPNGSAPLAETIPMTEQALAGFAADVRPRYVLLVHEGFQSCGPWTVWGESERAVIHEFTRLRGVGIRTFVLGFSTEEDLLPNTTAWRENSIDAIARAGGCGDTTRRFAFFDAIEPEHVLDGLRACIVRPYHCTLRTTSVPADPASVRLILREGGELRRDVSHVDGWDWVDSGTTDIVVHGPACDSIMAHPMSELVLLENERGCGR